MMVIILLLMTVFLKLHKIMPKNLTVLKQKLIIHRRITYVDDVVTDMEKINSHDQMQDPGIRMEPHLGLCNKLIF